MIVPNKELGQHFLTDENILNKIRVSLDLLSNDNLLEVGPGPAYLTRYLLPGINSLHAVEIDPRTKPILLPLAKQFPQLVLYFEDFLKMDLMPLKAINKACGNLPYQVAMPIIERISYELNPTLMVFMLAEGTALRLMSKPGQEEYSAASVFAQSFYEVSLVCKVSRNSFHPPPKIDSMVCCFKAKPIDRKRTKQFVAFARSLFSYRRKTLANALKNCNYPGDYCHFKDRIETYSISDLYQIFEYVEGCEKHDSIT
jgi:16S rRNA (adenine1518-N6/adenine1519-N6)-dimethyltransferase